MKKLIVCALVMVLALSLLAGCSGGGSNSGGSSNTPSNNSSSSENNTAPSSSENNSSSGNSSSAAKPGATYDPDKNPRRTVEVPDQPVDIADDSIYFVVIDGVTYNLFDNITVQDFLDAGYTAKESVDEEVEPGDRGGAYTLYKEGYEKNYPYFMLSVYNHTDKKIRANACAAYGIQYQFEYGQKDPPPEGLLIYTVGNLALGCTKEEVIDVFGNGNFEPVESILLQYADDAWEREWQFHLDESSGIVKEIHIQIEKNPR